MEKFQGNNNYSSLTTIYYFQTNIFDRKFFLCDIGYDDALSVGSKVMTRCYSHAVSVLFEICYRFI